MLLPQRPPGPAKVGRSLLSMECRSIGCRYFQFGSLLRCPDWQDVDIIRLHTSSDSPGIRTYQSLQASILHGMTSPELAAIRNQTSAELAAIRLHVHIRLHQSLQDCRHQDTESDFRLHQSLQVSGIRNQISDPISTVQNRYHQDGPGNDA